MRIRYLKALQAVMETGSVTEAGQRLLLTQPQVSRLIAMLEEELGFLLFSRENRRLTPTREGILFYKEANRILAGFDEVSRIADDIRMQKDAWLRIVTQPYLGASIVPRALSRFSVAHPQVRASLEVRPRADVGRWVSGQQFDLGIAALPMEAPAVTATPFARVRIVAAIPTGHPFAERKTLGFDDIVDEPFIALKPFTLLRQYIDDLCRRRNQRLTIQAEVSSVLSACQLVSGGIGLTLADPLLASGIPGITLVPWEPDLTLTYGFLYPMSYAPSAITLQFCEDIKATLLDMAPDYVEII